MWRHLLTNLQLDPDTPQHFLCASSPAFSCVGFLIGLVFMCNQLVRCDLAMLRKMLNSLGSQSTM